MLLKVELPNSSSVAATSGLDCECDRRLCVPMRRYSKVTSDEVVETLSSNATTGLSAQNLSSLRKAHGLNKLEEEEKVRFVSIFDGVSKRS